MVRTTRYSFGKSETYTVVLGMILELKVNRKYYYDTWETELLIEVGVND